MTKDEMIELLQVQLDQEKARNAALVSQVQAMELDTQRKEAVFDVMNNLLDATSEIVEVARRAIAANKTHYGKLRLPEAVALDERIQAFDKEDAPRYEEDLKKVDVVFQVAQSTPGAGLQQ